MKRDLIDVFLMILLVVALSSDTFLGVHAKSNILHDACMDLNICAQTVDREK